MRTIGTLFSVIALPLAALNLIGGILGSIWLIVVGQWTLPVATLLVGLFATWVIGFAMMPGLLLAVPASALADKRPVLGVPLFAASALWTYGVMSFWCVGIFWWLLGRVHGQHLVPTMLLAYATATSPWSYMASQEAKTDPDSMSFLAAFFAQIGCVAMMIVVWLNAGEVDVFALLKTFVPIMLVCICLQTAFAIGMAYERRAARYFI